jgi:uncharacterized protein YkwD
MSPAVSAVPMATALFVNITIVSHYLNYLRCQHNASVIKPSDNLNFVASNWGWQMASKKMFKHSNYNYGENIAGAGYIQKNGRNGTSYVLSAIDRWYSEYTKYIYSRPGFTAGHFTALVWNSTREFGVSANFDGLRTVYIVMEFNPPGNSAYYNTNVFKKNNKTVCFKYI